MRLASVIVDGRRHAALVDGGELRISAEDTLEQLIANATDPASACRETLRLQDVELDAPVRPPVMLCVGSNYADHPTATRVAGEPSEFFVKAGQTITGPSADVEIDETVGRKLDYETELGVVIGRAGRHITTESAWEHVYGYVVLNDVTMRDRLVVKRGDGSTGLALGPGKNFDGAMRMSSWLIPAADVERPPDRRLTTWVDDGLRQDVRTSLMLHDVPTIISYLSTFLTLAPGTVIATGSPGGTGWSMDEDLGGPLVTPPGCAPAAYLQQGNRVRSEIEGIGAIEFAVTHGGGS